jgi:hypothetical protein
MELRGGRKGKNYRESTILTYIAFVQIEDIICAGSC